MSPARWNVAASSSWNTFCCCARAVASKELKISSLDTSFPVCAMGREPPSVIASANGPPPTVRSTYFSPSNVLGRTFAYPLLYTGTAFGSVICSVATVSPGYLGS